ncbi:MAG TPA: 50S ribosomal protein L19 [Ignavibacteria bacterium]|nr:50S ribosomal protein L19 [Ignavibacteria bacterium]HAX49861.1 50S ribosomal protein L19 [Bacteroidota bacterium]HRE10006.1 50S ribosomal protein L19 [Ignavibacteria bacterium]HRF66927.1 50S ribosomal protein L19 [Ignavibacteria bacterium]HRJ05706.1 50S ribosomal protein L19 [Ignavibacteria bacterium]
MNKINLVTTPQMRNDFPQFQSGDTVNIHVKVIEGDKERIQQYQGIVMGIKGEGIGRTFRVRKISNGVGVERIFPIHSPSIAKIEKLKEGKVRRAKLYYLRALKGKSATKIKERISPEIVAPVKKSEPVVETAPVAETAE